MQEFVTCFKKRQNKMDNLGFKILVDMFGTIVRVGTILPLEGKFHFFGNKKINFGTLKLSDFHCEIEYSKLCCVTKVNRGEHFQLRISKDFNVKFQNQMETYFQVKNFDEMIVWFEQNRKKI